MSNPPTLAHDEKQFHKLMAQEAKADDMLIKLAQKEVKRAEAVLAKSIKVVAIPSHLRSSHLHRDRKQRRRNRM